MADGSLSQKFPSLREAGTVIDSLQKDLPWTPPSAAGAVGAGLGGWWDDFWNWVCTEVQQVVDVIQQVVITAADKIAVAIEVLDNGILKVFHFIVKVVEDAVNTVGSLLIQLGKELINTIEALSLIFHFGEILKTHQLIMGQVNKLIKGDPADPVNYPGLAEIITGHAQPAVQSFINLGDKQISNFIDQIKAKLTGQPVSQLKGQGATEHTAYQISPAGGAPAPTRAVQCSWGSDAMKRNLPQASMPPAAAGTPDGSGADPLAVFISGFAASISADGSLEPEVSALKSDFLRMFHSTSAADFLDSAVDELLDLVKALLTSALDIAGGLCSGALDATAAAIETVWELVTQPIEIPFISWLYQLLTRDPLTIIDAAMFVVAIPATILFQVITGKYPSQAIGPQAPPAGEAALGKLPAAEQILASFVSTFATFISSMINAVNDVIDAASEDGSKLSGPLTWVVSAFEAASLATSFPLISSDDPSDSDYTQFGLSAVGTLPDLITALVTNGKINPGLLATDLEDTLNFATFVIGIATAGLCAFKILTTPPSYGTDFAIAIGLAGTLPQMISYLKISTIDSAIDDLGGPIAAAVELIEAFAAMACGLILLDTDLPTLSRERAVSAAET